MPSERSNGASWWNCDGCMWRGVGQVLPWCSCIKRSTTDVVSSVGSVRITFSWAVALRPFHRRWLHFPRDFISYFLFPPSLEHINGKEKQAKYIRVRTYLKRRSSPPCPPLPLIKVSSAGHVHDTSGKTHKQLCFPSQSRSLKTIWCSCRSTTERMSTVYTLYVW